MNWKAIILLLTFSTSVMAVEDPPNCAVINGGFGNASYQGLNFTLGQAHVGDTVSLGASFGKIENSCKAINSTGSIYIATGLLTNFMVNVTLNPENALGKTCPGTNVNCEPGPYSFVITAPMVGAGVTNPCGSVSGLSDRVRAAMSGVGVVQDIVDENLCSFSSATISIVTPCIQVFKICGTNNCVGAPVEFTGYVTNCGDITLTNVNVVDDRTASLFEPDGDPLPLPLTLTNSQVVQFKGSFTPLGSETSTATNTITATGTDTTTIGGPNASVTNTTTVVCSIVNCSNCACPCLIYNQVIPEHHECEPMDKWYRAAIVAKL